MTGNTNISSLRNFGFEHVGWKYYNHIKKKAMEQEFSWSGLIISLSIAFFIVISTAYALNFFYQAFSRDEVYNRQMREKFYRLENINTQTYENYIQVEYISKEKIRQFINLDLA